MSLVKGSRGQLQLFVHRLRLLKEGWLLRYSVNMRGDATSPGPLPSAVLHSQLKISLPRREGMNSLETSPTDGVLMTLAPPLSRYIVPSLLRWIKQLGGEIPDESPSLGGQLTM